MLYLFEAFVFGLNQSVLLTLTYRYFFFSFRAQIPSVYVYHRHPFRFLLILLLISDEYKRLIKKNLKKCSDVHHVTAGDEGGQKTLTGHQELELQLVVSCRVSAGN